MNQIILNVGPSHISEAVQRDIREISASGILSSSHRGPVVQDLLLRTISTLKTALDLPPDYTVFFQPCASAAMELIVRNCVRAESFHFVSGAFGQRFAETSSRAGMTAGRYETEWADAFRPEEAVVPAAAELLTITHAETSTGRMWPQAEISALRARHPKPLLAVDATSTFGALRSPWTDADVWLGSVQKCLGLPAGLGYAVVSPRVLERAAALGASRNVASWQDLLVMKDRIDVGETVETPNVFNIALLERQAQRLDLAQVEADTRAKHALMQELMGDGRFFIREPAWRSWTVHNLVVDDPTAWQAAAQQAGAVLGAGYGPLKSRCIRIATFPAVSVADVERIMRALVAAADGA